MSPRELAREWVEAFNRADTEALVNFYSEDANAVPGYRVNINLCTGVVAEGSVHDTSKECWVVQKL